MIPAPPGLIACYKPDQNGLMPREDRHVIAFNDEGSAMILGEHSLIRADSLSHFSHVDITESDECVALIPAGGWHIEFAGRDGSKWSQPLVGWRLATDGTVTPVITDSDGITLTLPDKYILHHNDIRITDPGPSGNDLPDGTASQVSPGGEDYHGFRPSRRIAPAACM